MPLYPPPRPVEHPADLVIDTFGAFLGRKSERMIVRWRGGQARSTLAIGTGAVEDLPSHAPMGRTGEQSIAVCQQAEPPCSADRSPPEVASDSEASNDPARIGSDSTLPNESPPRVAAQAADDLLQHWAADARASGKLPSNDGISSLPAMAVHGRGSAAWQERAVPLSRLRSLTISGRGVTVSSDLIAALVERGVAVSFLSGRGQPVAQLSAPGLGGTVQTRRSQLAAYDLPLGVDLAAEFIRGKIRNQKHQLQYSGKYLKSTNPERFERLVKKIKAMSAIRKQLLDFHADRLDDVRDRLMGYEVTAARIYWEGVSIILEGRARFPGRITRGALDPINGALNYGYSILYGQVSRAIVNAGLEMYAGFLHVDRPGKPALVLDLVEEFRAPVVDRAVLAIVNQGVSVETDAHGMTAATRKLVADRVLERLATRVPFEGKRWPLGAVIQMQARHLAVAVRGERIYRAFASRW